MTVVLRAYILAGGKSSRFGSDKARAVLTGQTLIQCQAQTLRDLAFSVNAIADIADKYVDLGIPTIVDISPGLGPLAGIQTALTHAGAGWALVTSCDLLELHAEWIDFLTASIRPNVDAIVFRGDCWQPFPGLYNASRIEDVGSRLMRRDLACWRFLEAVRTIALSLPADWPRFPQANTQEELRCYEQRENPR
jgi:molybdopterin-guanine dinucleotide biosynthesis protein A